MDIGILWDYNGVLVIDEHLHRQALLNVLEKFDIPKDELLPALTEYCVGRRDADCVSDIRKTFREQLANVSQEELLRQTCNEFETIAAEEEIYVPGVERVLETFSKIATMGLVTGALKKEIDRTLVPRNLYRFFQSVVTGESVKRGKPDPEAYEKGREALGMPARSIVVIEDSPAGIESAHRAGLRCIAVAQTFPSEELSAAEDVLPTITDLRPQHVTRLLASSKGCGFLIWKMG